MNTFIPYQLGPVETPPAVKWLIIITLAASLATAVIDPLYEYLFGSMGLAYLLGLSKTGLYSFFIWQPATHLFLQNLSFTGITLGFLISLAFNLYILWIIGTAIAERIGNPRLVYFYLIAGAIAGVAAIFFAPAGYLLLGPYAALLALFTFWTMLGPESEILLFFVVPVKLKWLFIGVFGGLLLIALSRLDAVSFVQTFIAVLAGYVYGTAGWKLWGPFPQLQGIDSFMHRLSEKLPAAKIVHPTKIYDLRTGEPVLNDDQFIDAMLAKIAKHGEESLSWSERKRMQEISIKKRNQSS